MGLISNPSNYDEATILIGRLLAHFPRRDATKDGIVLSDLAGMMQEDGISGGAVFMACRELIRESSEENPFLPASGEILKKARENNVYLQKLAEKCRGILGISGTPQICDQSSPKNPDKTKYWADFDDEQKAAIKNSITAMDPAIHGFMIRSYQIPDSVIREWYQKDPERMPADDPEIEL